MITQIFLLKKAGIIADAGFE